MSVNEVTDELKDASLEEAYRTFFAAGEGIPPTLYEPARCLIRASDSGRTLAERVRELAEVSRETDRLFRDYLSPLSMVGSQLQIDEGSWPIALARWTELLHFHSNQLLSSDILPALADRGFRILSVADAVALQGEWIHAHFVEQIYPLLTPLAVDSGRPFPYISSDSLNLLVDIRGVLRHEATARRARVKIPIITPRLIRLPGASNGQSTQRAEMVWSVDLVRHFIDELFVDVPIRGVHCFRVLRSQGTVSIGDVESPEVHGRSARGSVVRVDVEMGMPPRMFDWLVDHLDVISYSVVRYESPGAVMSLPQLADEVAAWSELAGT